MASVSMVGQHPGPQLPLFKQPGGRKKITLPRKPSWEKMMFRRSSGSSEERGTVTAEGGEGTAARGGMMPGGGCGAPAAPRSPDRDSGGDNPGAPESQSWNITDDCNSSCDSNRNTGGRRGTSAKESGISVVPSGSEQKKAHRERDALPQARRDCATGDSGRHGSSSVSAQAESAGLPLERLMQGRTGVVKLARTEPHRREAWSIFPQGMDPRVKTEKGEGHRFETKPVREDWCDACSRHVTRQALKCQNCSYTCHLECQSQVQIDCNKRDREPEESPSPERHCSSTAPQYRQNEAKEEEEGGTKDLSEEEVQKKIEEYNAQVTENGMNLASDGSYTGFIKVHLRLNRPVTVPDVEGSTDSVPSGKRTSFYLPCNSVKQLHISSHTTTREVIQGLLKKFMVLDDPRKFALYRQTHRDGQDLFQKLPLCERPLLLRLIAGPDAEQLSFVLKENQTGEVEWHGFSVPELQNFLAILQKEEAERIRAVEQKYSVYRQKLQQALQKHTP